MAEQDRFELRLRDALRSYAAEATSGLDAVEFAHVVAQRQPRGRRWFAWRSAVSAPGYLVWLLILAALLSIGIAIVGALNATNHARLGQDGLIAFDTGGRIVLADETGRLRRDISGANHGDYLPSWSPDGRELAFWRAGPTTFSIVIADTSGRTLATLPTQQPVDATGWAGGAGGPLAWSPDGSQIACWIYTPWGTEEIPVIFIVPIDGSPPHQVGDPALPAVDPSWSPDGSQIVFAGVGEWFLYTGVRPDSNGLFVMQADGSRVHRVSHEVKKSAPADTISFREAHWQPGGDLIAYTASPDGTAFHVFVVHPDGTGTRDISGEAGVVDFEDAAYPVWAPDGRRLAFVRWVKSAADYRPMIVDADGTHATIAADVPVDLFWLTWAPDGRTIMGYEAQPVSGSRKVVLIDIGTHTVESVPIGFEQPAKWQWLPP